MVTRCWFSWFKTTNYLYNTSGIGAEDTVHLPRDNEKVAELGLAIHASGVELWSRDEKSGNVAYSRYFKSTITYGGFSSRNLGVPQAICLGD